MPQIRRGSARLNSDPSLAASTPQGPATPTAPDLTPLPPAANLEDTKTTTNDLEPSSSSNPPAQPVLTSSNSNDPTRPTVTFKTRSADQLAPNNQEFHDSSNDLPRRHTLDQGSNSRRSLSYSQRPREPVYYDSRAATRDEYNRRGHTLQEYYEDHPELLPQLPFTWHHGRRRWRLWFFAFLVFVDASAVPIALYYGLHYAGHVEGWIIFAVVTTIWGGPTYLELAIRSFRLIKKERFYRPLGTNSRWCFDMTTWASVLTIFVVTTLFIVGSAPHIVWLRVLCMPAPALLYCLGGWLLVLNLYNYYDWPAPCRISSTAKGGKVRAQSPASSVVDTWKTASSNH